ncbi:gypsy retrotransposon integrase 1 [Podarcis lilfordi]|uniref:Gypsy retrotransposon integrase-like protein 1 n=1 Tax=Podarcis lilfordi TaxID=74358 RepID=A0AA35L0M4_9SAUR|nr:gypsy retrotransposon integrase 1 [Podarcis lilfordi]
MRLEGDPGEGIAGRGQNASALTVYFIRGPDFLVAAGAMVRNGKNGGLHLKQISYYKQTGGYHPTTLASERSGIRRAAKKFVFRDNSLFYVGKDKRQMRLVILSDEEKRKVLEKCHENHAGAHHGISRTLTLVESQYYWTSVTSDVKQWVYACEHCQVAKNTAAVASKFHSIKAEDPWTVVTLELMGPFDATSRNNVYVILLTDVFTKWVVVLPLHDLSAAEVAKAVVSASFCYGPPQKITIDQEEEFVHQINRELFEHFGTKELIMPYPQADHENEAVKTIRSFLLKYCTEHTKDWDDHLQAISYAFNLIDSETSNNTPYFQMFKRNPYIPSTLSVIQEGESDCMFVRILSAIRQAEKAVQERTISGCQNMKKMPVEQRSGNMSQVRKKPKQVNQFLLKVGHEVLRQKKNWWKDGRFQSEWVGPCIIDYVTDNGCAILRDASGSRLKRPIKISHLKPYIRGSQEQDSSYIWQSAVMVDHDYVGSSETSAGQSSKDVFSGKEPPVPVADNGLPGKDRVFSECDSSAELTGLFRIRQRLLDAVRLHWNKWYGACQSC